MHRDISPPNAMRAKRKRDVDSNEHGVSCKISRQKTNTDTFRVFSWNIDGIGPFLQQDITKYFKGTDNTPKASLRGFLHRHNFPELLFLQEVKINKDDQKTRNAVAKAVCDRLGQHDTGPDYQVHFTLPKDNHNIRGFGGKVYGVCSVIRRDFAEQHVTHVRDVDWDLEGRVSVVEVHNKLAIWNIYAVNGTDNPHRDPISGTVKGTRHERKLAFHRLLLDECKAMETAGWSHIIAGDLNVAPSRIDGYPNLGTWPPQHVANRADFNEKFLQRGNEEGLGAIDVFREANPTEKKYTYHPRGRAWGTTCDRVDLILVSRKMWIDGMVTGAGILDSIQERGPSDHVPLWVEAMLPRDDTERKRDLSSAK